MRSTYAALAITLVTTAGWAPPAVAQRGGDDYSLRRYLGSEAYLMESFSRPTSAPQPTVNPAARQALPSTPAPAPPITSGTNNTLNYYGAAAARQTLEQIPRGTRFIPQGGQRVGVGATNKPYAGASTDPPISPYLNLFREESEEALPNYYTFVRPYQTQIETNRAQQRQIQGLQRQAQRTSQPTTMGGASAPPTGVQARFGDTGQYYSGWK